MFMYDFIKVSISYVDLRKVSCVRNICPRQIFDDKE